MEPRMKHYLIIKDSNKCTGDIFSPPISNRRRRCTDSEDFYFVEVLPRKRNNSEHDRSSIAAVEQTLIPYFSIETRILLRSYLSISLEIGFKTEASEPDMTNGCYKISEYVD